MIVPTHDDLLTARYGSQPKPEKMIWNEQIEQLLVHRSVRAYLPDALPDGALETMVAAAQSASTSSNLNQWSVVAVSNPCVKKQLAYLARTKTGDVSLFISEAPTILLWVVDASRNYATAADNGTTPEVFDYLDSFIMGSIDTALAAQNAVVAAESIGLGVVYIGSMRNHAKELAELIGLPRYSFVAFGMGVGYPDPDRLTNIRPRLAQDVVLHRERYSPERPDGWLEAYEAAFKDFRFGSGMRSLSWVESVKKSVSYEYMDGRQDFRETVQERGFKLD